MPACFFFYGITDLFGSTSFPDRRQSICVTVCPRAMYISVTG
jgi:hypothetical protein